MNQDFAYLLGALGDGCLLYRKEKAEYCIEYEQKIQSWLVDSLAPRFQALYGVKTRITQRNSNLYRLRVYSKKAFFELSNARENLQCLLSESAEVKANFIRGFFDAEGSVPKRKPGTSYRLEIYQKDKSKLVLIAQMLGDFGISSNKITNSRDVGQLNLRTQENIARFRKVIGSEHQLKAKALQELC